MLVFISYDRYNVIVNGVGGTPLTKGKAMGMALFSWGYAIGWAIPPFVGWGKYMPEGKKNLLQLRNLSFYFFLISINLIHTLSSITNAVLQLYHKN